VRSFRRIFGVRLFVGRRSVIRRLGDHAVSEKGLERALVMQEEQDEKGHGDNDDRGNLLPVWKDRAGRRSRTEARCQHNHNMISWDSISARCPA
jgi:hypothetical protein